MRGDRCWTHRPKASEATRLQTPQTAAAKEDCKRHAHKQSVGLVRCMHRLRLTLTQSPTRGHDWTGRDGSVREPQYTCGCAAGKAVSGSPLEAYRAPPLLLSRSRRSCPGLSRHCLSALSPSCTCSKRRLLFSSAINKRHPPAQLQVKDANVSCV